MRRRVEATVLVIVALAATSLAVPGASAKTKAVKPPSAAVATQRLGLDLLREMPPGNLVVSPSSVATALAMAGTGARGRTAEEMAHTLHLGSPRRFKAVGRLQQELMRTWAIAANGDPEAPIVREANALFAQAGLPIEAGFTAGLRRDFAAISHLVDFEGDMAGALAAINGWVSDQTGGLIPVLFDSLGERTRLVLANAVYLDAKWRAPFNASKTSVGLFRRRAGTKRVAFMHETGEFRFGAGDGYQALELPYRASTLSMLFVLPETLRLGAFQRGLGARDLTRIAGSLSVGRTAVGLPSFHIAGRDELDGVLRELGMPTAFSESADFTGMNSDDILKIGKVMHAANITVDEAGTVAGAATGVAMEIKSKPRSFTANHPFLFFLRDRKTGAVLFAGRVTDPAA